MYTIFCEKTTVGLHTALQTGAWPHCERQLQGYGSARAHLTRPVNTRLNRRDRHHERGQPEDQLCVTPRRDIATWKFSSIRTVSDSSGAEQNAKLLSL